MTSRCDVYFLEDNVQGPRGSIIVKGALTVVGGVKTSGRQCISFVGWDSLTSLARSSPTFEMFLER